MSPSKPNEASADAGPAAPGRAELGPAPLALYESAAGCLFEGCGVRWLEEAKAGSVDLVVADPPYNLGKAEWDRFPSREAYLEWSQRWVQAAWRALTPTGTLYLMGFSELLAHVLVRVEAQWASSRWLVWYYRNKANLRNDWGRSHESLLLLRKGKRFTFNTDPVRVPYNSHTTRYPARTQAKTSQYGGARKGTWTPHPLGARPRDVLEIPVLANGTKEKTAHPTQKPVQLIRRLILASSNEGELVVDPFLGSGTSAVVAEACGRRWVGVERDPEHARQALARLKDPASYLGAQTSESEAQSAARRRRLR